MKKISVLFLTICIVALLSACSNLNNDVNYSDDNNTSFTSTTKSADTTNEKQTTSKPKKPIVVSDLPDNFVDCTKYIGKDVSVFGVDLDQWDFDSFMQEIGKSQLYGNKGTVKVELGWDNRTIINVVLLLDEGEYIQGDEYKDISTKLEQIFGKPKTISDGITDFFGKNDFAFRLTRNGAGIGWNDENRNKFNQLEPTEPTQAETTTKPKKEPKIGMTADEIRQSTWGEPKSINKTTYSWGTKEQWCYSGYRYIYFENGIVTAIQEHN